MEWNKYDLEMLLSRAKGAIAGGDCLNMSWYLLYAATLRMANDPDFVSTPLIYDRMTDAEKSEYERLERLGIEPVCKFCLAVYKRELPKIIDELAYYQNETSKYDKCTQKH